MDNVDDPWNFHTCKLCSYRTRFIPRILTHVRLHRTRSKNHEFICHSHAPENHQCEECPFQSDYKVLLTSHVNTTHKTEEAEPYPNPVLRYCENCDFETFSTLVLLRHHNRCAGRRNRIFQTSQIENEKRLLQMHQCAKLKKISCIQCEHCSYKTTYKTVMKKHVLHRHTPFEEIDWFKCKHCSYKAKIKYHLTRHNQAKHAQASKRFECSYKTTPKINLKSHVLCKPPPSEPVKWFKCDHCSYKAKQKRNLLRHNRTKHAQDSEAEKPECFECDHCSYKSSKELCLKSHIVYKHTPLDQIDWFNCRHCTYKAKMKADLRKHMLRKHTPSDQIN